MQGHGVKALQEAGRRFFLLSRPEVFASLEGPLFSAHYRILLVPALARSHLQLAPSFWSALQFDVPRKDAVLHGIRLLFQGRALFLLFRTCFDGTVEFDLPEGDVVGCRVFVYFGIGRIFGSYFGCKVFLGSFELFGVGVYLQSWGMRLIFDHSLVKFFVICQYEV